MQTASTFAHNTEVHARRAHKAHKNIREHEAIDAKRGISCGDSTCTSKRKFYHSNSLCRPASSPEESPRRKTLKTANFASRLAALFDGPESALLRGEMPKLSSILNYGHSNFCSSADFGQLFSIATRVPGTESYYAVSTSSFLSLLKHEEPGTAVYCSQGLSGTSSRPCLTNLAFDTVIAITRLVIGLILLRIALNLPPFIYPSCALAKRR
jgi:hypothetical protein